MASSAAQALANKLLQPTTAQQQQQQQQQLGVGSLQQQLGQLALQPATSTQQQPLGGALQPGPTQYQPMGGALQPSPTPYQPLGGVLQPGPTPYQPMGGVLQPSSTQYQPLPAQYQRQPLGGALQPSVPHQPYGTGLLLPSPTQQQYLGAAQQPYPGVVAQQPFTIPAQQSLAGMMQPVGAAQQLANKLNQVSLMPQAGHSLSNDSMQQLIRSDRGGMLTMSDDHVMMKQIQSTHAPDGREVDIKPLFQLVEDILNRSTTHVDSILKGGLPTHQSTEIEDKNHSANFISMLDALSYTIDRISCEIACKALGGADAHATTVSIFNMLTSYSWDAKLVLSLAAFALNYGEFWLLAQIYTSNPLAKSMALLKQLPFIMEHSAPLKPRFDALNNLIKAMMDVTRVIVDFRQLPVNYITQETQALSAAMSHIPTAVYWSVRSVVACATQITNLTSMGHEYLLNTVESWELSTFTHKLRTIYDHLRQLLEYCLKHIEEKKDDEYYYMLLGLLETLHIDNYRFLKALIYPKDDLQPLIDGSTKKSVNIDVLRRRNVLLLISGMDISNDELSILEQIYNDSRHHAARTDHSPYEIVWIPIVEPGVVWNEAMNKHFENLRSTMPWYSVCHPSIIDKAVVRFIKNVWHFRNKPVLVVLDPQGKVVCPNALHMMWIWGSSAFPFTSLREEALWRDEAWKLDLVVDSIDPEILNWIQKDRYIFLFGGDDVEWIRKFTSTVRTAAQIAHAPVEMAYVGKSSKKEQVRRAIAAITSDKLSHCWDPTMIWFFWTRLESMLFSKIQLGQADDHDMVMQGIKKLLSYDKEGGWVLMARGPQIVALGHANTGLTTLVEIDLWKGEIPEKEFHGAYADYHNKIHAQVQPCCRFDFTSTAGKVPDRLKCPECHRHMEKFTTFKCCHDDPSQAQLYN